MTDDKNAPSSSSDETRRKFQEALERKRNRDSHGAAPSDSGKSLLAHENSKRQRQFRRKSG